jgi:hypothetical protein
MLLDLISAVSNLTIREFLGYPFDPDSPYPGPTVLGVSLQLKTWRKQTQYLLNVSRLAFLVYDKRHLGILILMWIVALHRPDRIHTACHSGIDRLDRDDQQDTCCETQPKPEFHLLFLLWERQP